MPALLNTSELAHELETLPGWTVEGLEMVKNFVFPTYLAGADFVARVATESESMNHHPDLLLGWRKVTVRLSTHSRGGLTDMDIKLARKMEEIVSAGD